MKFPFSISLNRNQMNIIKLIFDIKITDFLMFVEEGIENPLKFAHLQSFYINIYCFYNFLFWIKLKKILDVPVGLGHQKFTLLEPEHGLYFDILKNSNEGPEDYEGSSRFYLRYTETKAIFNPLNFLKFKWINVLTWYL